MSPLRRRYFSCHRGFILRVSTFEVGGLSDLRVVMTLKAKGLQNKVAAR